jgi:hypothetical protein
MFTGTTGTSPDISDDDDGHAQFTTMIDYSTFGTSVNENELLAKEGFHGSFHSTGFSLV